MFLVFVVGEELGWIVLGSVVGLVVGPVALALPLVLVAGGILGYTEAPTGTATWKRLAPAVMLVAVIAVGLGLGLGSRVEPHGRRDVVGLVVALLGLDGDVLSPSWLWVGRAGAIVIAACLTVIVRTARRAEA